MQPCWVGSKIVRQADSEWKKKTEEEGDTGQLWTRSHTMCFLTVWKWGQCGLLSLSNNRTTTIHPLNQPNNLQTDREDESKT